MNRRAFFVSTLGNLAWLLLPGCVKNSSSDPKAAAPASANDQIQSNEIIAYEKQNQARLDAAIQRTKEQQRLSQAVAQTEQYRWQVRYVNGGAWTKFIGEHSKEFMTLRLEAARSSSKTVSCTICDGRGSLSFCVVCKDTGKCPTCNGTGALLDGEICPTCQGNGKCFLCHGSGKMTCPFCDDGLVYAQQPDPPGNIPIS